MWWLHFTDGGAAIVAATSLAQARLLAVIHGFGRAAALTEGFAVDPDLLPLIPDDRIGRKLTPREAEQVLIHLREKPRRGRASRAA
jgi:hypothetical protein